MAHENTHNALKKNTGTTPVSMSFDKADGKPDAMVSPAVWVHDYVKKGKSPRVSNYNIYAGGAVSASASIVTSLFKSIVDDEIKNKLNHVKSIEPALYRNWIKPCHGYTNSAPIICAIAVADTGTTVWHHPIGIWLYVTDANGKPVVDYKPVNPTIVYRPDLPLRKSKTGGYYWSSHSK